MPRTTLWVVATCLTAASDHFLRQLLVERALGARADVFFGTTSGELFVWSVLALIVPIILVTPLGAWAGRRFAPRSLIRLSSAIEVIALCGFAWALNAGLFDIAFALLCLKGTGSALFGVWKYTHLHTSGRGEAALMRFHGRLEAAALVGVVAGTLLATLYGASHAMTLALYGGFSVCMILAREAGLRHDRGHQGGPAIEERSVFAGNAPSFLEPLKEEESVFLSALGVGWFWFLGAFLFVLAPSWSSALFASHPSLMMPGFFLIVATGLCAGFFIAQVLARGKIELGLVPFASFGISIACLGAGAIGLPQVGETTWRVASGGALFLLALSGGIFTVPLQSFLHATARKEALLHIVAGTNWLSAVMMCAGAGSVLLLLDQGVSFRALMCTLCVVNVVVMWFIYDKVPRFVWSFMVWVLTQIVYRFRMVGRERIPMEGAAIISCNHPSYIDFLFVAAALSHRPPRFIMHHTFFKAPIVGWLFRNLDVIPIAPKSEDKELMRESFDVIARSLEEGELVCIFPEGLVTYDGKLNAFRPGIERIVERTPVPVVPIALKGLWGSYFSRAAKSDARARARFPRFRAPIELEVGQAIAPGEFSATLLGEVTARMGGWEPPPELNSEHDRAMQSMSKTS